MPAQPQYHVTVNAGLEIFISDRPAEHTVWFSDVEHAAEIHQKLGQAIDMVRRERGELEKLKRAAVEGIAAAAPDRLQS